MKREPLVLVIDEEPLGTDSLVRTLRSYSLATVGVGSAREGRRLLLLLQPDVVIIEPAIEGGFELLEEIRLLQPASEVIVVTNSDALAQRAREAGAENVVIKSSGMETLIDGVVLLLLGNWVTRLQPPSRGARILLVDSENETLDLLSAFLSGRDYVVVTARTGTEALETVRNDPGIALVVLNLIVPEMCGLDMLKEIRSRRPHLGVIMLSSIPDRQINNLIFELGAFDCMPKPVDLKLLEASIVACLALGEYRSGVWWKRLMVAASSVVFLASYLVFRT